MGLARGRAPELADEALDAVVVAGEGVVVDQVLPDGHGVAAAGEAELDDLAVGLAGARLRAPPRRSRPRWDRTTFTRSPEIGGTGGTPHPRCVAPGPSQRVGLPLIVKTGAGVGERPFGRVGAGSRVGERLFTPAWRPRA